MAYVNKRADIERQKAQQYGNFAGALIGSTIQAGANEIMRIQQQKDDDTVQNTLATYVNTMESDYLDIQNTYGSEDWNIKFYDQIDTKKAEIQDLDMPKRIKDRLISGYDKAVNDFEGKVKVSIVQAGVNEANRITNNQGNYIFEHDAKQAANYLGVELVTGEQQEAFAKGRQLDGANKTFVDG
ncbi:MAG: hypothetical protein GX585_05935, partial [Clostridiales bacterium]|nr:hypothetical protein [Clostridiales bacterium]